MSAFASIAGPVAGALVGGMMGNRAAKYGANANRFAVEQQMRPFNLMEPYLRDLYSGSQGALSDALATGAFGGPTFARLDPMQQEGIAGMGGFGRGAMTTGQNLMNVGSGFGQNASDIFNRASGRTIDDAVNYATSSPQAQSLIDAAMRDSTRRLNEQTLPGISQGASATGNTNSSRAGVAEALAQRAYDDRRADVGAQVGRNLMSDFMRSESSDLRNMMAANRGLQNAFGVGTRLTPAGAEALTRAGGMLQTDAQGQLDADREAFQRQRDFALGQYGSFGNILRGMPSQGQRVPVNTANPYTAALSGSMMGFGVGGNIYDYFNRNRTQPPPAQVGPTYTGFDYDMMGF